MRDELDYFSGLGGSSTGTGQHFTEDNLRHDAYDDMAFELTDGIDLHDGISSEIKNGTEVVSVFITGIQYDNHYHREQQFINGINILLR